MDRSGLDTRQLVAEGLGLVFIGGDDACVGEIAQ